MAATKKSSKEPAKTKTSKSMDVTNAQATNPGHTARPVIVSNRPMIKDPMVNVGDTPATDLDTPTTSPVLPARTAKTIAPKTDAIQAEDKPELNKKTGEPSDTAPELDHQVPQLVKNIQREKAAESEVPEEHGAKSETSPEEDEQANTEKTGDMPPDDVEAEATSSESAEESAPEGSDEENDSHASAEDSSQGDTQDTTEDSSEDSPADGADKTTDQPDELSKADAEEAKATARAERIQELVDDKTYFLPIKSSTKNSTKAGVLLVLIVVAAAAAYYYMFTQR